MLDELLKIMARIKGINLLFNFKIKIKIFKHTEITLKVV